MQLEREHLTSLRVAEPRELAAKAWLARRWAWEERLRQLGGASGPPRRQRARP